MMDELRVLQAIEHAVFLSMFMLIPVTTVAVMKLIAFFKHGTPL